MFELKDRDGLARRGLMETRHGKVHTPNLAPVIHPLAQDIVANELRDEFGVEIVMTNSYTLWRSESRLLAVEKGLHGLIDFDGPIMTDSGTFQSHVYGDLGVTNQEIVEYQRDIKTDFGTVLDVFSEPEHGRQRVERDVRETLERTFGATEIEDRPNLIGAVQGGLYEDVREYCAQELSRLDVSIHAIGGVVPLMESYRYRDLVNVIVASKRGLRLDRPVHLFGAGHPMVFALSVLLGCDLFDSSSYDKYARAGRLMFVDGTRHLDELDSLPCDCPACATHDVGDFRSDHGLIARHNLYESFREIRTIRNAIKNGEMWELVEMRCHGHPALLDALREVHRHNGFLERFEPSSRPGAFFYVGPESVHRPGLQRLRRHLQDRYRPPSKGLLVILPEGAKPYYGRYADNVKVVNERADAHFIVKSSLGAVPLELDEYYPFSQSVVPERMDVETMEAAEAFVQMFVRAHGYERVINWAGVRTLEELPSGNRGSSDYEIDVHRARAVADVQFGRGAGDVLVGGSVEFVKSPNTGRIRNVIGGGVHVLSMRAHDGQYTLKLEGARLLHKAMPPPAMRVVVESDTAEFNRQGKNVFAKFVLDCDPELRPGDECLVVDEKDQLVAVGRTTMSREEMLTFDRGVAVDVREGSPGPL